MFFKRSSSPELMDDFSVRDERIDKALKELDVINRFLGGRSVTFAGLDKLIPAGNGNGITLLDIGAGSSYSLIKYKQHNLKITAVDINKRACLYNKRNFPGINVICADAAKLPFKEEVFDVVHASLFFHHFKEEEIIKMLKQFLQVTRYGIVINDLRRSLPAYLGIKLLTSVLSNSRMVKHDGPLSVRRAFIKKDLIEILSALPVKKYIIKRKWAFRWLVIVIK